MERDFTINRREQKGEEIMIWFILFIIGWILIGIYTMLKTNERFPFTGEAIFYTSIYHCRSIRIDNFCSTYI